ncbi:MAG: hypothetical protein WAV76_03070 [Bacteroidota bacterium]
MFTYTRGDVYFDLLYHYPDHNESCEKLLLVLNKNHSNDQDVVIIPSATNKRNFTLKNGCNKTEKIYYIEKKSGFYHDKSMIQLEFVEGVPIKEFERRIASKQMKSLRKQVTDQELQGILGCLKSIREDIPVEVYELIF